MNQPSERLRWGIGQRLEFIEFRLYWDGRINRRDLVSRFDISVPQASADLARYEAAAPGNLKYDDHQKTYLAALGFRPKFYEPSARQYLSQLRAISDRAIREEDTWLGVLPAFEAVPLVRRRLDPERLREALQAIRTRLSLKVVYQSLSRTEPTARWIAPHALGFDGFRWHVRAWCFEHSDFRDFVLARVLEVADRRLDNVDTTVDLGWHRFVTMRIGPDPRLGELQRRAIELDYGMNDGSVEVQTRVSLAFYLERQLLLDEEASGLSPKRVQLKLLNRKEVTDEVQCVVAEQSKLLRDMTTSATT